LRAFPVLAAATNLCHPKANEEWHTTFECLLSCLFVPVAGLPHGGDSCR
jgi:hypothetical protein